MDSRLLVGVPLVFSIAVLQNTALFFVGGIKVNVIIIIFVAYAFMGLTFFEYCVLLFSATVGLMPSAGWNMPVIAFSAAALIAYGARKVLPFQPWFGYYAILGISSVMIYVIIDWRFVTVMPLLFFREVIYTMIGGALLYAFAVRSHAKRL